MNSIHVRYLSDFQYDKPISEALFEFRIKPQTTENQRLVTEKFESNLGIRPIELQDYLGGSCYQIRVEQTFTELKVLYEADVEVLEKPLIFASKLDAAQEHEIVRSVEFYVDNQLFIRPTVLTKLDEKLEKEPIFNQAKTIFEFAHELNAWVYELLQYTKNITTTETTANQVAQLKRGVCQDYTHLFLAVCRKNGLPCRYVSGYIGQQKNLHGDDFMHAWVEVLIPEIGWIGFDPTNNLLVDNHFVKVCHGVDYTDCKPIKGVLFSSFYQSQNIDEQ